MAVEPDERAYLGDILTAIDRVLDDTREGRDAFLADPGTQDTVVRNLQVIGDAVKRVSESTRGSHPEIPWSKLSGNRYGTAEADLHRIWNLVQWDLPRLRHQIGELLPVFKLPFR